MTRIETYGQAATCDHCHQPGVIRESRQNATDLLAGDIHGGHSDLWLCEDCAEDLAAYADILKTRSLKRGYQPHDGVTEWQECDTCHLRLGAEIRTEYDAAYYSPDHDPARCPRCTDGIMALPAAT